jgi:hypothetical protein
MPDSSSLIVASDPEAQAASRYTRREFIKRVIAPGRSLRPRRRVAAVGCSRKASLSGGIDD